MLSFIFLLNNEDRVSLYEKNDVKFKKILIMNSNHNIISIDLKNEIGIKRVNNMENGIMSIDDYNEKYKYIQNRIIPVECDMKKYFYMKGVEFEFKACILNTICDFDINKYKKNNVIDKTYCAYFMAGVVDYHRSYNLNILDEYNMNIVIQMLNYLDFKYKITNIESINYISILSKNPFCKIVF
jgi:hypothetical protein